MPILYLLLAAGIVAADQIVKALVRGHIPLLHSIAFLPGLDLTYVKNTGAAFSSFSAHTWVLTLLSGVVSVALVAALWKKWLPSRLGMLSLALILAGAVGNFIDRLCLHYVTDMFQTTFMNFPVFNVADMGVTVGGVLLCVAVLKDGGKKKEEGK